MNAEKREGERSVECSGKSTGTYVTFQLTEGTVPRGLFEKILGLIAGLKLLAQPT